MKNLFRSRFFIAGLVIRVLLLPFFGSTYLRDLFIPFLDESIRHFGTNPWSLMPPHFFPYGSVLFAILFIPRALFYLVFGSAALGTGPLGIALVKLPLLGIDVLMFMALARLARGRASQLIPYYWLNPIIIYITYLHGQLDIAAMYFCILSVALVIERKPALSALAMAAATLCKFHVVVIAPFILAYLWNRDFARQALRNIAEWTGIWAILSAVGFLPLIFAKKFLYASATSPEAFRVFGARIDFGHGQVLYLGVLLVLAVLGRLCVSRRITDRGLIFGSAAIFGTVLLATHPMPGWYFWVLPFLALFYACYANVPRSLFWTLNFLYFVYFDLLFAGADRPEGLVVGVAFTLLQTSLAGMLVVMWNVVVRREAVLQGRGRPAILGLAGDSGSGKNHLALVLQDIFNPANTVMIEGDDYHKWERTNDRWNDYTHLHPKANDLSAMANHAVQLAQGLPIVKSEYDHSSGYFTSPREIKPSKTVIVQGLHTFYLRGMRENLDLKIFLMPHETVRMAWKIKRDVRERGYELEKVVARIAEREQDSRIHIAPQRRFADWIVEYIPTRVLSREEILAGKLPEFAARHVLWNDAPVAPVIEALRQLPGCQVSFEIVADDIDRVALQIAGDPPAETIRSIAEASFPSLRHITRGRKPPRWRSGLDGVSQLVALALLSRSAVEQQGPHA